MFKLLIRLPRNADIRARYDYALPESQASASATPAQIALAQRALHIVDSIRLMLCMWRHRKTVRMYRKALSYGDLAAARAIEERAYYDHYPNP